MIILTSVAVISEGLYRREGVVVDEQERLELRNHSAVGVDIDRGLLPTVTHRERVAPVLLICCGKQFISVSQSNKLQPIL